MGSDPMGRRVYLHIGAPKTGTSYVQDRLRLNRGELARHLVHYPLGRLGLPSSHFKPALDLIERDWGGARADAEGAWATLMRRIRRLDGTVLVSHEILAVATPEQVARAMQDLRGSEVHVVYSARDIARQVPAAWQESVKQYQTQTYKRFLDRVRTQSPDLWFWQAQGLPDVLTRWGAGIPPERIHLVTVPRPDAPRDLLWQRFRDVFGIQRDWTPRESPLGNTSMGSAETTLVRKLNKLLHQRGLPSSDHRALVTELLVHQNLARRTSPDRTTLPPAMFGWAEEVAQQWVDFVRTSGMEVVGDLEELRPARPAEDTTWRSPDRPGTGQLLDAAMEALAVMVREAASRPRPDEALGQRISGKLPPVGGQ